MAKTGTADGPTILWFRDDLRLSDHPALDAARERGAAILCIFVLEQDKGLRAHGGASRWWLHHSLAALESDVEKVGGRLDLFAGEAAEIVPALAKAADAGGLYFNRRYGRAVETLDESVGKAVKSDARIVATFNGRLLNEPWQIKTKSGRPYGVYTPYWKAARAEGDPGDPLPKPRRFESAAYPPNGPKRVSLKDLDLLPTKPNWAGGLKAMWTPGEAGAAKRLEDFLENDLEDYAKERNMLASKGTPHLSPHLRFGEISPRQILAAVKTAETKAGADGAETFLSEIGWREFNYHVMHYNPTVAEKNLHDRFDKMPWRNPLPDELKAWQRGQTGFPVVDAGMRQLWQTGYMHNRVRMITASFLVKDLMCDWRIGEKWFWDCLCDADPANNPMNWQWVAGCGADAAPFFRIFNPVTQGLKFDPDGDYVRRWVPELARLKGKAIHAPWELDVTRLTEAGIELGKTYPKPMVDHKKSRAAALAAYEKVK